MSLDPGLEKEHIDMDIKEMANSNKELIEATTNEADVKRSRFLVYKNLLCVGLAWVFFFTAYQSIANLQSSLNSDGGLGTVSLSTIYVSLIVSCIFLPTVMIKRLGIKWTIIISQFAYISYIGANIYPRYYTLVPTAVILGLGAAPLWTAKCTFLTDLGTHHSRFTGETPEVVINRFFGIFFAMFQSSGIWGNIISATVLKPEEENTTQPIDLSLCGINDCPNNPTVATKKPPLSTVYLLCGIYIGCAFFAVILIFFLLDSYKKIGLERANKVEQSPVEALVNTVKHLKHLNQILIIPLTLWSGFQQAFIGADFTRSYITCIKSVRYVGIIMLCYGATDTIGSYGFGYVIKYIGRIPCFIIAACMNFTAIGIMIFYVPNEDNWWVLFICAVLWGLGDAVWQTQINSFYGVIFMKNSEAAFSNYRLWESLGFAVAYAYSNFICIRLKIYLLIAYLATGMLGYGLIEYRLKQEKKSQAQITPF